MKQNESGLLSLEACIVVPIFIFLMLFLYSYFGVFETRNQIAHATLATANSLGLDAYESVALTDQDTFFSVLRAFTGFSSSGTSGYTDSRKWYIDSTSTGSDGTNVLSDDFADVVKTRFLAYLGGGDMDKAEALLQRYSIHDGVDGLDFSSSHSDGDKVWICVRYTIDYEFKVFHPNGLALEQTACSKIWK